MRKHWKSRAAALLLALCILAAPARAAAGLVLTPPEEEKPDYAFSVYPGMASTSFSVGVPYLYAYGPAEAGNTPETGGQIAQIAIQPRKVDAKGNTTHYIVTAISVRSSTPNVRATVSRHDGTLKDGRKPPELRLEANSGARDAAPGDYEVKLSLTIGEFSGVRIVNKRSMLLTVEGKKAAAYAQVRELESGERYTVSEEKGSCFHLADPLTELAKVRVTDQAELLLEGDYGTADVNLRAIADPIPAVERLAPEADLQFCDFIGEPAFLKEITVSFRGPQEAWLYRYDRETGACELIEADYRGDAKTFATRKLGCYFLSGEKLPEK